jgi:hypothetical protein
MILALKVTFPPVLILTSAADLKSLTHLRQNRVQGLQIESGTGIIDFPVPITFRSPRKGVAAMERGLRKWAPDQTIGVAGLSIEHRATAM